MGMNRRDSQTDVLLIVAGVLAVAIVIAVIAYSAITGKAIVEPMQRLRCVGTTGIYRDTFNPNTAPVAVPNDPDCRDGGA